jgi:hypothetical protein
MSTMTTETIAAEQLAAGRAFRVAETTLALSSLVLLARTIRDEYPDAKTVTAEWSDQGDHLSAILTVDAGLETEDDDYDDQDGQVYNLDESTQADWVPFATYDDEAATYTFDLDRLLTDAAQTLADHLAATDLRPTASGPSAD